ncbi:MAG: gliding motility lipoprotein GldH [Bacteroidales bacterium]|nr:gliding motility lipoprotein GldH [Bacteroidales bacterium]
MVKSRVFIGIIILLLLFSCDKNKIFHEVYAFDNYQWEKSKILTFEPEITSTNLSYKFIFNIRYFTGFPYKYLHLNLNITNTDGQTFTKEISIQIISEDLKYLGEGMGDYWDIDYVFIDKQIINKTGKYKIEIQHNIDNEVVTRIGEFGITISKL